MPILDMVAGFWPTANSLKNSKSHIVLKSHFCSFDTLCPFAVLQFRSFGHFQWQTPPPPPDLPIPAGTARIADLDIWVLSLAKLQMLGPRFGDFALHASRSVDIACIRWITNPGIANGAIRCQIDPGNGDIDIWGIWTRITLYYSCGPCANLVFCISSLFDRWDRNWDLHFTAGL